MAGESDSDEQGYPRGPILLIGSGQLARSVGECLRAERVELIRLREPVDRDVRSALARGPAVVLIATLEDIAALRYALLVEYIRPGVRLIVTIFDRTVAGQVRRAVGNCLVLSAADLAVPALVGPCVQGGLLALAGPPETMRGVRERSSGGLEVVRPASVLSGAWRRLAGWLGSQLRPFDVGGLLLVLGAVGLLAVLIIDTILALRHGQGFLGAWYAAVKVLTDTSSNPAVDRGSQTTQAVESIIMLAAAVLFAAFTAGLVQHILSRRLVTIVGRRTLPRHDQVVVVGLDNFGLRLCMALRDLGLRVLAVERDGALPNVSVAKRLGIPVVIGHVSERLLLQRLALRRARALAAVTSDDITNVSVAVAALAVRPDLRIVLRAFEGAVTEETQALFHIGVVRDVFALAAAGLASAALGGPTYVAAYHHATYVLDGDDRISLFPRAQAALGGQAYVDDQRTVPAAQGTALAGPEPGVDGEAPADGLAPADGRASAGESAPASEVADGQGGSGRPDRAGRPGPVDP